jgi:hypothetical protein
MPVTIRNTDILFNNGTTQSTAATGSVSSVATGNGLQGGTITTSGTLSVACPTFNTVGSYCFMMRTTGSATPGTNYSAGSSGVISAVLYNLNDVTSWSEQNNLSGTWKWMGATTAGSAPWIAIGCRVS